MINSSIKALGGRDRMGKRPNVVAVIDDDVSILDSLKKLLWACGYDVELYASSGAFVAHVSSTAASCLIVDVQIGASNGIELVSQLKAVGCDFPTIFITGSDHQTVEKSAKQVGCIALLRKPLSAHLLAEALVNANRKI